jgi:hypothetical protein
MQIWGLAFYVRVINTTTDLNFSSVLQLHFANNKILNQSEYQYFLSKPKELTTFGTELYAELLD